MKTQEHMSKDNVVIGDTVIVERDGIREELKVLYVWENGLFLCDDNVIYTQEDLVEISKDKAQTKKLEDFSRPQQDILLLCKKGVSRQHILNKSKYFYDTYEINQIKLEHIFDELYSDGFIYKILNKYKSNITKGLVQKV